MKNLQFRIVLSAVTLSSMFMTAAMSASGAPVKFRQVKQIVNAKPGRASTGNFSQIRLANGSDNNDNKGDDKAKTNQGDDALLPTAAPTPPEQPPVQQDDNNRVITETSSDIVEDEACDCVQPTVVSKGFPKYALLGLGAIPLLLLIPRGKDKTPTPTVPPTTETPTMTPPPNSTPTPNVTPTPNATPPPPEPVPEPMTILLFGTGLAGVGMAARKRLGKKEKEKDAK